MEDMKAQELEFELVEDPTPEELNRELTFLANSSMSFEFNSLSFNRSITVFSSCSCFIFGDVHFPSLLRFVQV